MNRKNHDVEKQRHEVAAIRPGADAGFLGKVVGAGNQVVWVARVDRDARGETGLRRHRWSRSGGRSRADRGAPPVPLLGPDERDRFLLDDIDLILATDAEQLVAMTQALAIGLPRLATASSPQRSTLSLQTTPLQPARCPLNNL